MSRFKIEKTTSYQLEDQAGCYIGTLYSRHDALLLKELAEQLKGKIKGLCPSDQHLKKQPKGFYQYMSKEGKAYPFLETYDRRLDRLAWKNRRRFKGEA